MDTKRIKIGCVDIWIDEIVPCLKDAVTGEIKETVVFKIESRKFLSKFKKSNGWHIDWDRIPKDVEVYALALMDTHEIQGIIGLKNDKDAKAVYIFWACTAPQNNRHEFGEQKYVGVGGHLFAIAVDKAMQCGYEGLVYGFAANKQLLKHYIDVFGAEYIGILHDYHFILDSDNAKRLLEVYRYEWN